ncbi:MAG: hypothetical protein FWG20_06015 [Candidatus Cloacimonetes bacterium]|nr:hypothetical protein [Candidatus Cloacimonadota bacterium]
MKRLLLALGSLVLLVMGLFGLIGQITDEQHIYQIDNYKSAVVYYDNRVIAQNESSIIEYEVYENGCLNQISYHEIPRSNNQGHLQGSKYYSFINNRFRGVKQLLVFDLLPVPMELIASVDYQMDYTSPAFVLFDEYYILISDNASFRIALININTYEIEYYLQEGVAGSAAAKQDNLIAIPFLYGSGMAIKLFTFHKEEEYFLEEVGLVLLPDITDIFDIEFQEGKLIVCCSTGIIVYEVESDYNFTMLYDIPVEQDIYFS